MLHMDYNIHKICRVCLEEGALTSIYSTEFAMMPSTMMMMCAKIKVFKSDGLPAVICNNCIYRLGVAYHFKQECENSDIRLRQYLGLPDRMYGFCDAETNTEVISDNRGSFTDCHKMFETDEEELNNKKTKKNKRKVRYKRKPQEEHKKRGPKPLPKLPQTCYDCNKTFKCTAQLQMHIRTHTGEKPFACSYCSRRFAQKYNLQIHERTHTGERPFQCEICSKQFSALGNFQAHQKIHTGVRDQCCPVCQKSFYTAGDLSKHMITHTGIKNHHCDVCGKSFSRLRDMQAHKRKLHVLVENLAISEEDGPVNAENVSSNLNDRFKCPECDKEFSTANCLSAHFRSHNNGNLIPLPLTGQIHPHAHHYPLPHDGLHPHHHIHAVAPPSAPTSNLVSSTVGSISANVASTNPPPTSALGMAMSHATMAHILAPTHAPRPPPPPTPQNALSMMHAAQRLHPY